MKKIKVDPEFVTAKTEYGIAYAWRIDQDGLLIIEDSRKECAKAFKEAYLSEFNIEIEVILEEG